MTFEGVAKSGVPSHTCIGHVALIASIYGDMDLFFLGHNSIKSVYIFCPVQTKISPLRGIYKDFSDQIPFLKSARLCWLSHAIGKSESMVIRPRQG